MKREQDSSKLRPVTIVRYAMALETINETIDDAEPERIARWHDTFNAALTGLCANPNIGALDVCSDCFVESLESTAADIADWTHGPIGRVEETVTVPVLSDTAPDVMPDVMPAVD